MKSYLLGLSTAVPSYSVTQSIALQRVMETFPLDDSQKKQVTNLYQNSGINTRYVITPDFNYDRDRWEFWGKEYPKTVPGMTKRNDLYKQEAKLLAHQASEKAILDWGGDSKSITHVVSVSCTGVVIPGIEFSLIKSLGLKPSIYRLGINFMGCFGAFKGIEVAKALAKENPKNRVLVVCTELCSLHLQGSVTPDDLAANSIFADGAAAIIIGCEPTSKETPIWEIIKNSSFGIDNTLEQMSWEASDNGFLMKLSGFVALNIARHIKPFTQELLTTDIASSECNWAIHPGGKAILQIIEKKLQLEKDQTQASWNTLANYGNMSSATFLFVLDSLRKETSKRKWTAGLGFGPGLSVEGLLLKNKNYF